MRRLDSSAADFAAALSRLTAVNTAGDEAIDASVANIITIDVARARRPRCSNTRQCSIASRRRRCPRSRLRAPSVRGGVREPWRRGARCARHGGRAGARLSQPPACGIMVVHRSRRHAPRPTGHAFGARGHLRTGRQGSVSLVRAHERTAGAGRRRGRDHHGCADSRRHTESAGAGRGPRRRRHARFHRRRRAGDRRAWRTARRRFPRSTRSSGRATPTSRRPSAECSAWSAST